PLGLVEMTRQNVTDGVREILTTRCPTCDGEGVVRSAETVAIEALRKLRHDSGLIELEEETGKTFLFEGGDALPIDTFEVAESGDREEIERRALPFQI